MLPYCCIVLLLGLGTSAQKSSGAQGIPGSAEDGVGAIESVGLVGIAPSESPNRRQALLGQQFVLVTELLVRRWVDVSSASWSYSTGEALASLWRTAFGRWTAREGLGRERELDDDHTIPPANVQIIEVKRVKGSNELVRVGWRLEVASEAVGARVVLEHLATVGEGETGALLGLRFVQHSAYQSLDDLAKSRYWVIGLVVGSVLGLCLLGWFCLFLYFNTCGRRLDLVTADKDAPPELSSWMKANLPRGGGIVANKQGPLEPLERRASRKSQRRAGVQTELLGVVVQQRLALEGEYFRETMAIAARHRATADPQPSPPPAPNKGEPERKAESVVEEPANDETDGVAKDQATNATTETAKTAESEKAEAKRAELRELLVEPLASWSPHLAADQLHSFLQIHTKSHNYPRPTNPETGLVSSDGGIWLHSRQLAQGNPYRQL